MPYRPLTTSLGSTASGLIPHPIGPFGMANRAVLTGDGNDSLTAAADETMTAGRGHDKRQGGGDADTLTWSGGRNGDVCLHQYGDELVSGGNGNRDGRIDGLGC